VPNGEKDLLTSVPPTPAATVPTLARYEEPLTPVTAVAIVSEYVVPIASGARVCDSMTSGPRLSEPIASGARYEVPITPTSDLVIAGEQVK
jgi:hypothetical protein